MNEAVVARKYMHASYASKVVGSGGIFSSLFTAFKRASLRLIFVGAQCDSAQGAIVANNTVSPAARALSSAQD